MKYTIFILSFISLNACATSLNCYEKPTQLEMSNCAIEKLNLLESKLNKRILKITRILEADKKFTLANKQWLIYREAHCESTSNIYSGGSIYNFALTECKAKETQLRINTLESDYKDTINIITKGAP